MSTSKTRMAFTNIYEDAALHGERHCKTKQIRQKLKRKDKQQQQTKLPQEHPNMAQCRQNRSSTGRKFTTKPGAVQPSRPTLRLHLAQLEPTWAEYVPKSAVPRNTTLSGSGSCKECLPCCFHDRAANKSAVPKNTTICGLRTSWKRLPDLPQSARNTFSVSLQGKKKPLFAVVGTKKPSRPLQAPFKPPSCPLLEAPFLKPP